MGAAALKELATLMSCNHSASHQSMLGMKLDTDSLDRKQSNWFNLQFNIQRSLEVSHSQGAYEPPRSKGPQQKSLILYATFVKLRKNLGLLF